jgi:hypothetical protein
MPFPGPAERTRVSTGGATLVRWDPATGGLVYLTRDRRVFSATVRTAPALSVGTPVPLFTVAGLPWLGLEVAPDGKRLLAIVPEVNADELPLTVVTSFAAR